MKPNALGSSAIESSVDVVVVGGGLAGLIAAANVARAGRSVAVLEQSKSWGGRAATQLRSGVHFNLGAHALYCNGHAKRLLEELNIPISGRVPNPGSAKLLLGPRTFTMPLGLSSLATTRFLTIAEKWRFAKLLKELPQIDARSWDHRSLSDWTKEHGGRGNLKLFLEALVRVATYAADHQQLSAGVGIDQVVLALAGNVLYLDGGWQRLIDGLRDVAQRCGAKLQSGAAVEHVQADSTGAETIVQLKDGSRIRCAAVILAVSPDHVGKLLDLPANDPFHSWLANRQPVRAACLDVALSNLPRPKVRFALGADQAYYFSVHTAAAKLAPDGISLVHTMKYLQKTERNSTDVEQELESVLDQLQPGWRKHVVERRFLPSMIASEALPTAATGGLRGRPGPAVATRPSVFVAGDWVGSRGMLADAAAASAELAAQLALGQLPKHENNHERNSNFASAGRVV